MIKKYGRTKDMPALYKALSDSEFFLEEKDEDKKKIGGAINRVVLKILKQREMEIEEALQKRIAEKKNRGPYTHAEATAPDD